jgi:hypothetical protein
MLTILAFVTVLAIGCASPAFDIHAATPPRRHGSTAVVLGDGMLGYVGPVSSARARRSRGRPRRVVRGAMEWIDHGS